MECEKRDLKMGKEMRLHCLVVPFPTQGHINPMLQFSKRLQHKGINITLAPTLSIFNTTIKGILDESYTASISIHPISDGHDEGGLGAADDKEQYLEDYKEVGSRTLGELIGELKSKGTPVHCIVYDAFMPWVLDVAKRFGLLGGAFFTMSCAVGNIFCHVNRGELKLPLEGNGEISLPGLTPLQPADFPSFISDFGSYPAFLKMLVDQFSNVKNADWIFCNTIYELEEKGMEWAEKQLSLKTIGPTIPSMYVDKRLENDRAYGLSMFQPETDVCLKWLSERADGSVVYVSFGSMAEVKEEQMEELASGLKASNYAYLWVVRASEEAKLPRNFAAEKGLVVTWCPQLDVLSHDAIGCFVTHCGWNSTLEALSLGVAMVAIPVWTDQSTNAKYVSSVWGTGLRAHPDNKGVVRKGEVERCLREVMEGDQGKKIIRNTTKWKEIIRKASDEDGSSDRNINEFIAELSQS
nr:UDP-glycosyltransferase 74F2-like [Ipomoea batatas]